MAILKQNLSSDCKSVKKWNTCIPVADSCWYMAKPIQYCKVKKIKIKKGKKKKETEACPRPLWKCAQGTWLGHWHAENAF